MPSERLQKPVLVLNASYEPINVCAARRALVLVLKGVASAEEVSVTAIHSARNAVRLPSVIRLLEYRRIPRQTRALSRKNILMRDRYTCQYCHRILPSGGEPELGVPVGVDADSLGRAGELFAHDWSGRGVEGEPDDVEQVGGFLGTAAVHHRLQLHRDQGARFGDGGPDLDADSVTGTGAGAEDDFGRGRGGPV